MNACLAFSLFFFLCVPFSWCCFSSRCPYFQSNSDTDAIVELGETFGVEPLKAAAKKLGLYSRFCTCAFICACVRVHAQQCSWAGWVNLRAIFKMKIQLTWCALCGVCVCAGKRFSTKNKVKKVHVKRSPDKTLREICRTINEDPDKFEGDSTVYEFVSCGHVGLRVAGRSCH